jgi:purine-binding chemotaxis protein CheW
MQIQEILIIKNGAENYGIPTEDINQISRVPMLMPLPLRPRGVRGLCAVAGTIVSLLDLNLLLDMPEVDYDNEQSRLISLNGSHASNALLVSEVYNAVEVDQSNIEYIQKEDDPVIAIYKYQNSLVQVISLDELVSKINKVEIESKEVKNGKLKLETDKEEESNRFLIFNMGRETFALNIEYLQEIILADVDFTEMVGCSDEVLGLITLRDELLIVIDLRTYYGFDTQDNDKNRILIASYNGKRVGLLIDEIIDIKNFPVSDMEYMEDVLDDTKITGVIHAKDSLISFFDFHVLEDIFKRNDAYIDSVDTDIIEAGNEEQTREVIVFKLHDKEYAFEVDNVDEIIDIVQRTEISFTDAFIDGIINIRGQIVTIVSLFEKLNIPTEITENSKIIICNINDVRIGFVVDSVSDILDVKESDIREDEGEFFNGVLHLEDGKRLVLSMDINSIVETKEIE